MLRTKISMVSLVVLVLCLGASVARAQTIQIDEEGHGIGTVGGGFLAIDPGPKTAGDTRSVLTFTLSFTPTQGDVIVNDLDANGIFTGHSDVFRFNGNCTGCSTAQSQTVIFYSDIIGGADSFGDVGVPTAVYSNLLVFNEVGPEGANGFIYTPTVGQPGFNPAAPLTSYRFVSDGNLFSDTFQVNYFAGANGARPDQTVRITNTGTATDPAGSTTSDLCANIYVFRNDQQLAECCSCLVTPNGLRTLSVDFDLTRNPLTAPVIGEGVIKIVASSVNAGATPCPVSKAGTPYTPSASVRAWGTHNQDVSGGLQGAGVVNAVTETPFSPATLSQAELNSLQTNCAFIRNQGSGHGICLCGRGD